MEGTENKRKHLLEPIRDLAQNWSIDLATELEDYLHELEEITISFDGGETNVNFAEAALLIQGSACVYSKKVEYLYNLLYHTLEAVVEKKRKGQQTKSSINNEGVDLDALFSDEPFLLPLDDHIRESKNIDLDDAKHGDEDGDDYESYAVKRSKSLITRSFSATLMVDDNSAKGEPTYKISSCVLHESGALLFGERDGDLLDDSVQHLQTHLPFGSPQALMLQASARKGPPSETDKKAKRMSAPLAPMDDMEEEDFPDMGDGDFGPDLTVDQDEDYSSAAADAMFPAPEDDDTPDLWATVEPHEAPATKRKPFRKGKCASLPSQHLAQVSSTELLSDLVNVIYASEPAQTVLKQPLLTNSLKTPYYREFSGLFMQQLQERGQKLKAQRVEERTKENKRSALVAVAQHDHEDDEDEEDNGYFDFAADLGDNSDEEDEWNAVAPPPPPKSDTLDAELDSYSTSYEELCREQVNSHIDKANKYLKETQISRRVEEWRMKLLPSLEAEDNKPVFDIHAYGSTLMEAISEAPKAGAEAPMIMDFHAAMQDRPRYEVCRFFLATLQLANNHNVTIEPSQVTVGELGDAVSSMKLEVHHFERTGVQFDAAPLPPPKAKKEAGKSRKRKQEEPEKENVQEEESEQEAMKDEAPNPAPVPKAKGAKASAKGAKGKGKGKRKAVDAKEEVEKVEEVEPKTSRRASRSISRRPPVG
jgi:condensin-2 complex subunit H2